MSKTIAPKIPRGMRDILPQKMILRQYVTGVIQGVFEEFGFEPLLTPAIELSSTLKGKYGEDAEKLIYNVDHEGGKEKISLRYDLSVPLCRVIAKYPDLPKPFKRYQISPVWRADRPQRGRYREFWQCDADTVGSASMLADAETIKVIYEVLTRLRFSDFKVMVNNRKILNGLGQYAGLKGKSLAQLYRSIDKLRKIGVGGVKKELKEKDLSSKVITRLLELLETQGENRAMLEELKGNLGEYPVLLEGVTELDQIIHYLDILGVPATKYQVDFSMARGLEYYTGPIYETIVEEPKIGSITGGGRFDQMVGMFMKRSFPATGTTIGIDRIIDVIEEKKMYPPQVGTAAAQALVTVFDPKLVDESLMMATQLRRSGVKTQMFFDTVPLRDQLGYAQRKGIPNVVILGPDEIAARKVTIRNFKSNKQESTDRDRAADLIKEWATLQ